MKTESEDMREGWHLDKKVPLTIIFALICQTVTLLIWGVRLDGRVVSTENAVAQQSVVIESMRGQSQEISVSLARIQERQNMTSEAVQDIKNILQEKKK